MAGIGFALKKIYKKNTVTAHLKGAFYSVFATIGHVLIIIAVQGILRWMLKDSFTSSYLEDLYSVIIIYAFIFPMIFTSGISIVISRYISDKMWSRQYKDISASLIGVMALYIILASIPALVFLWRATDLSLLVKVLAYAVYMNMGLIFLLMVYVSAIKNYANITVSYLIGMGIIIFLVWFTRESLNQNSDIVAFLLAFFALGTSITAFGIYRAIRSVFYEMGGNYFGFLLYIRRYPKLIISNFAYVIMLYTQNFLFWAHEETRDQVSVFIYSGDFDLAMAFAVYTILPAVVIFVVRTEVNFYDTYRSYLEAVDSMTGMEIRHYRKDMERTMWEEFLYSLEVQGLLSMVFLITAMAAFPFMGIYANTIDVFPYFAFGIYLLYFSFLACTLMQYFENYDDSMRCFALGVLLNLIFGIMTMLMGKEFYGLGIVFSSLITFIYAILKLRKTVREVDIRIFTRGAFKTYIKKDKLDLVVNFLNDRMGE